jgi:putative glycosyltransferase (TIGR04372 family)
MLRPLKRLFRLPSIVLSCVLSTGIAAAVLVKHARKILKADLVVVHGEGGFGYTITTPDMLRRDRPGQRIVILFAYVPGTHNILIGKIWPDIDVLFVPCAFRRPFVRQSHPYDEHAGTVALFPSWDRYRYILFGLLYAVLRMALPKSRVINDEDFYTALPDEPLPAARTPFDRWHQFYFRLLREVPAKPLCLPESDRRLVADALARAAGGKRKLCCLYLRLRASRELPDAFLRSGGDVATYIRAVKRLNERGFQVLLVGDRHLPPGMAEDFKGMFVDAASLKISKSLFYLYAATESQIAIGECGGGFWVGPINGIPSMLVNNYPFHIGWQGMALYFKALERSDGTLVPAEELFAQFGEDVVHSDPKVVDNCAAELEAAITHFADSVEAGRPLGVPAAEVPGVKPYYWQACGESFISPFWLELYGSGETLRAAERDARAEELLRLRDA